MSDMLTVKETAYELSTSERTVRRWVDEGRIDAYEFGPTKRIRIPAEAVEKAKRPAEKTGKSGR